jgi:hypothetical protein
MLNLKFPVIMARREHLKIVKDHYFALIFSITIDFKVLQPYVQTHEAILFRFMGAG